MTDLQELQQLLADIREAIEPYVDNEQGQAVATAARAAVQSLIETKALELDDGS